MNLASIIATILTLIRPFIPLGAEHAHKAVERWATIPKKQREKFYAGMSAEDRAEAEQLQRRMTDAISDYTVFVASRGEIPADEAEEAA